MTADLAIHAESVGKRYRLGTGHNEDSLGHRVDHMVRAPFRRLLSRGAGPEEHHAEEFWALRDVSIELPKGEILGLIGPNGSGKSTFLKILSNITHPTEGRIALRGRVGTLLEVGTGFHPELTGRENVYLNGAILGMRRHEIDGLFDEIVEFSGIDRFLDTPVKRYSSGMFVRLAFAVAAHLDTEILLVDEVLAVGDTEFQRKCLGKIDDVARGGRTIIFVSHNLTAVERLCTRSIWLQNGRMVDEGPTQRVVAEYLKRVGPQQRGGVTTVPADAQRVGSGEARLTRAAMLDEGGEAIAQLELGQPFSVVTTFEVAESIAEAAVEVGVETQEGSRIATSFSTDDLPPFSLKPGTHEFRVNLDLSLMPGEYAITIALNQVGKFNIDHVERVLNFAAINVGYGGAPAHLWQQAHPAVRAPASWAELSGEGLAPLLDREQ
jgi:lipopolysaccharide transport system ATP-binding protein